MRGRYDELDILYRCKFSSKFLNLLLSRSIPDRRHFRSRAFLTLRKEGAMHDHLFPSFLFHTRLQCDRNVYRGRFAIGDLERTRDLDNRGIIAPFKPFRSMGEHHGGAEAMTIHDGGDDSAGENIGPCCCMILTRLPDTHRLLAIFRPITFNLKAMRIVTPTTPTMTDAP